MAVATLENQTKERSEIAVKDSWNLDRMYSSWDAWESDFSLWGRGDGVPRWPEIASFRERCKMSASDLRALIECVLNIERHLLYLYTYAHLRHDEDVAAEKSKGAFIRISSLLNVFRQETAWIEPEILQIPDKKMGEFLESSELAPFRVYLDKIIRVKPHLLSAKEEELLALSGDALAAASRAFGSFNNADLKFAPVEDSKGQMRELTHGKYLVYLRDSDRKLREGTFKNIHRGFLSFENTLAELINGQVQSHLFQMKARSFSSCMQAALFSNQVDPTVYTSLIAAVRRHLPSLHRYMALRKKVLGYSQLHLYDLLLPLTKESELKMNYEEAVALIVDSVALMGAPYVEELKKGLTEDRWVDRYENKRKRSGAYSSGCYGSSPYILMNYQGSFNDVMTLTHEAGHSMHSLLSRTHQPYQYCDYSIFVAEVASTFHEELLLRHLLTKVTSKEQKAYLINQKIDAMRSTLIRQTMFAEFELQLHSWAEQGVPLTPSLLKSEYRKLNLEYFGPDVVLDEEVDIEWARIPHFYYNFYVYQYATGISAAHCLVDKVLSEGDSARDRYLQFLSSGGSRYPVDLLKITGVDMSRGEAVEAAMHHFGELVAQLEKLL